MNTKSYLRLTLLSILIGAPFIGASEQLPHSSATEALAKDTKETFQEKLSESGKKEKPTKQQLTVYAVESPEMAKKFAESGLPTFLKGNLVDPKGLCSREKTEDTPEAGVQITFADFVKKHKDHFDLTVTTLDEQTTKNVENSLSWLSGHNCTVSLLDEEAKVKLMAKIAANSSFPSQEKEGYVQPEEMFFSGEPCSNMTSVKAPKADKETEPQSEQPVSSDDDQEDSNDTRED